MDMDGSAETARLPLLLLGAGGHSKVVAEIALQDHTFELVGLIDRHATGTILNGVPVVGNDDSLASFFSNGIRHVHVAIGDNSARASLADMALGLQFTMATLVSPAAIVSRSARLGQGVVVMGGAIINAEANIGDLTIINTGANIDHDCKIGRAVHIAPGCTLAGNVTIGDRAFVGAGATIIPGVTLGHDVIVGAGACVIRDVAAGQKVVGVPARVKNIR